MHCSTSPGPRRRTTLLNANVLNCYITLKVVICNKLYVVDLTIGSSPTWMGEVSLSGWVIALLRRFFVNSASHNVVYWDLCYTSPISNVITQFKRVNHAQYADE